MEKHISKLKRRFVTLLLLIIPTVVFAQSNMVTGRVTGSDDGEAIPGVSIIEKGTTNGTITDLDGNFSISIKKSPSTLVISMIGMVSKEMRVTGGEKNVDVVLAPDMKQLEQIVVTGYSSQKKADLTGAVSVVKMSDIKDQAPGNVMKGLQGRVPGVYITSSGSPDNSTDVQIRGVGTLSSDKAPLYIIDGMPSKKSMNEINSLDIESIQVLKDASAATIYGSRAANGVVIITTRKGEKGVTRVDLKASLGVKNYSKSLNWLNTEERGYVQWQAARNDGTNPNFGVYSFKDHQDNGIWRLDQVIVPEYIDSDQTMRSADTDWANEIGRNSIEQNYNLTVSQGNEKGSVLFSLDYLDNDGTVRGTYFERISTRVNSDYHLINKRLKIGENLSLTKIRHSLVGAGDLLNQTRTIQPIVPVHTVDGVGWGGPVSGMSDRQNPVRVIDDNKQNHKDMLRLFGDVNLDFEIIKDLHFRSMLGMDYSFSWERNMQLTYKSGFLSESVARLNNYNNLWGNWVWSNTLNYNFDLGKNKFDLLAGQEMIDYYSEWTQAGREGYTSEDPDYMYLDAGEKNKTNSGSATAYRLLSYFGKVNYSFDSRYLASFTIRYDGSSRFGSNNRFGTFPAFSLGWRLSEEAFMESTRSVVSDLKLRYGWGKTGNQEIGDFASYGLYEALYGSDPTWNPDNGTAYDIEGNGVGSLPSGYRRIQQANPNLRWETATQNNIGLDFGFWDQKLFGSFDYFMKTTEDILIKPPYIATLGEGGDRWVNGATLDNKGYEFILSYVGKQGDFKYEVTGNIAGYRNKVVKLPDDVINSYPGNGTDQTILGRPLNSMFGYIADGIFRTQEEVDAHAAQTGKGLGRIRYKNIYDSEDDMNEINDRDRTWLGVADPKFVYGLNFSLTYKLWDFSMFWNGIAGGKVYNSSKEFTDFVGFFGGENYGTRTLDAWTPQNSGSDIPALSANDLNWERRYSTYFIESSSYFKLRSLELGYRLSDKLCKSMYMQGARFYFLGENLLTIKKSWGDDRYTGIDPETPNSGYPIPFSLTFGVNVSF